MPSLATARAETMRAQEANLFCLLLPWGVDKQNLHITDQVWNQLRKTFFIVNPSHNFG